MKITELSIRYPVSTTVGVILLVMFGVIGLSMLPIQLTPTVERPEITVSTVWPGASPQEMEREIIDEQEEQLKSLEGLVEMESSSSDSRGEIVLTFQVGTDLDTALLKVSNRLQQVPEYPEDADKPVIRSVDVNAGAMAWFSLEPAPEDGFEGDISTLYRLADEFVKPEFERVPGVAAANIYGGRERELQVIVDPAKLASRRVTLNDLAAALERENRNYSGGDFDEGKRRYVVRTVGEYRSPEDVEDIVVAVRNGVPIYLRDVARAELGYHKPRARVYNRGRQVLAMNAIRESGSNVMEAMAGLQRSVAGLNAGLLRDEGLTIKQVYDETDYIRRSIDLVRTSLLIGGLLAAIVLMLFLRSFSTTLVIAVAMPISLVGTLFFMWFFGRSLNVISLAGMAFAVGIVVDNSIVVLENIYRHRQMGKSRPRAAADGASEVWGAVLASTLTTIAVFVPVVFIREEVGQMFGDIAIALSVGVALSLLVAVTVIPSLSARILHTAEGGGRRRRGFQDLWGGLDLAGRSRENITRAVRWIIASTPRRLAVTVVLTSAAILLSLAMRPPTEYLPLGNQNFLFGIMQPPPGYSLEEVSRLHDVYLEELSPLWEHEAGSPEAEALPGGGIREFWFVSLNDRAFMGASANEALRVRELEPEFRRANARIPGAFAFIQQASIFQNDLLEGRSIDVEITGPDLEHLIALGREVFFKVMEKMPGAQARPVPSLDLGNPEVRVVTHRRRAAELGLSNRELGYAVSALVDGAKATDYQHDGLEIDLRLMAEEGFAHRTHLLEQMPIAAPDGQLVTLGSVAHIEVVNGPVQINHGERQRTIAIQVGPPKEMPLESAMKVIDEDVVRPMREAGRLGGTYRARLTGTADKLVQTGRAMFWNILLALAITYLLMAALFESFLYPLVIMFSVPLAALGGFMGLRVVNLFVDQKLDVLTMLGFVILIGTVVNNAILIVHQSLNHMRAEGMAPREAIGAAVHNRIRPIFMSVGTSVLGMLPLVLFPGAGSELYRGLGAVVIGGLIVSTLFTLVLVPSLFSLALDAGSAIAARMRDLPGLAARPEGGPAAAP
ncbi:MAG: efflux RND transporter permease subunit [Acidobacteriota bacterium]